MNLQAVRDYAESLLAFWSESVSQLASWKFDFNNRKRALGLCYFQSKLIEVSRFHAMADAEEHVKDTIKHEIAHALAFIMHGTQIAAHGREWKEWAQRVGCSPAACVAVAKSDLGLAQQPGKWYSVCPGCSREFNYHRKPKYMVGRFCIPCGPEKGSLTVIERGAKKLEPEKKSRFF